MSRTKTALVLAAAAVLAFPAAASALQLGVQDDWNLGHNPAQVFAAGHQIDARWVRILIAPDDPAAANKIRAAHAAGFRVLLTIGGVGTTATPTAPEMLAAIRSLPVADRYTVINEPDLLNLKACDYRARWMAVRRVLGRRLLWGDFSPWHPLTYTQRARQCGPLPATLAFAMHPYQRTDPLAPGPYEGSIGNLGKAGRWLRKLGIKAEWWLDEFGYELSETAWAVHSSDATAMWPRAIRQARRNHARMLSVYMADGNTWDSAPTPQAMTAIRAA